MYDVESERFLLLWFFSAHFWKSCADWFEIKLKYEKNIEKEKYLNAKLWLSWTKKNNLSWAQH